MIEKEDCLLTSIEYIFLPFGDTCASFMKTVEEFALQIICPFDAFKQKNEVEAEETKSRESSGETETLFAVAVLKVV